MMRKEMLNEKEFKEFFDDIVKVVVGTKGAKGTLLEVLEAYDMSPEYLPESVANKIMPILEQKAITKEIPHNCSWCPTCGLCAACGGLNAGSLGACAASSVHILD